MKHGSVTAVAVCPQPPVLVPRIASGAAPELRGLRDACDEAVRRMYAAGIATVLVLAAGAQTRRFGPGSRGDFGRYGVPDVTVGFGPTGDQEGAQLPLGLLIGAWLLARSDRPQPRVGQTVRTTASKAVCAELGRVLAADPGIDGPVGLLVMGDGSARRTDRAPGAFHAAAGDFDHAVAAALESADTAALSDLDARLAEELLAAGRAPWQVLAAAAGERRWRSELLYHDAPYGVGYFVASWSAV